LTTCIVSVPSFTQKAALLLTAIPYTLFYGYFEERNGIKGLHTPETAHLKAYECLAYAAITIYKRGLSKLRKLDPRADVGYLVGYNFTNIYRIWIPYQKHVIFTRNVIFDKSKFFNGRKKQIVKGHAGRGTRWFRVTNSLY
jgi:hypothetical protein